MGSPSRVFLLMGLNLGYTRNVLRGIRSYALPQKDWILHLSNADPIDLASVRTWKPTGIIARVATRQMASLLRRIGCPVVNVTNLVPRCDLPRVGMDDTAAGSAIARYFVDRGYRNFAYVARQPMLYAGQREQGYVEELRCRGLSCHVYEGTDPTRRESTWSKVSRRLVRWLIELPKPCALLGCTDRLALQVLTLARVANVRVPEDLAVVGIDHDDLVCELAYPQLSSLKVPGQMIGYQAAKLLDRLMSGRAAPSQPILLPPGEVVTRQSSDMLAIDDAQVVSAVLFIRAHAAERIGVDDVVEHALLSRRALEQRFRQHLGRSPFHEIRRVRVELARQVLDEPHVELAQVAERAGFGDVHRLIAAFKAEMGITPAAYRRQRR